MPPAGVVIPQKPPGFGQKCGTTFPGWINGTHPTDEGSKVEVEVCFSDYDHECGFTQNIEVTHCGSYFVYFLAEAPGCAIRYCGADTL